MTGEQLRAIRKALGWTTEKLAGALGMSRAFVGEMERNKRPIERRTELAARYIEMMKGEV